MKKQTTPEPKKTAKRVEKPAKGAKIKTAVKAGTTIYNRPPFGRAG